MVLIIPHVNSELSALIFDRTVTLSSQVMYFFFVFYMPGNCKCRNCPSLHTLSAVTQQLHRGPGLRGAAHFTLRDEDAQSEAKSLPGGQDPKVLLVPGLSAAACLLQCSYGSLRSAVCSGKTRLQKWYEFLAVISYKQP